MKTIIAKRIHFNAPLPDLEAISQRLGNEAERNRIDIINWTDFPYKPDVSFAIGYTPHELLLNYYVTEDHFKAEMTGTNQNVFEDSCVEFFVAPAGDGIYYNFEFNGIGTCLMGSGTGRAGRERTDPRVADLVRRLPSLGNSPVPPTTGPISWTLTIAIPLKVFFLHNIGSPGGKTFLANFYKCGDKLEILHYLSWNRVVTPRPDFHQPAFFGQLIFES